MKYLLAILLSVVTLSASSATPKSLNLTSINDDVRGRLIPIKLYPPIRPEKCTERNKCKVLVLSSGYGLQYTDYSFLANKFSRLGYLTVAVQHELPGDPSLSVEGDLYQTRQENWQRGARSLEVVRAKLAEALNSYDFDNLILLGHSNGGDISAWLGRKQIDFVRGIITLDHRRVPLPRNKSIAVLSIRAGDFPADAGVLPSKVESEKFGTCLVKINNAKHNDLWDGGPEPLKEKVLELIQSYLLEGSCPRSGSFRC